MDVCDIACGIRHDQEQNPVLANFAQKVKASYIEQWLDLGLYDEDVGNFALAFEQVMTRTIAKGGRVHFNLNGVDVAGALAGNPEEWMGRYTAWELQQIVKKPNWLAQTIFYLNNVPLSPEQVEALGISFP